MPRYGFVKHQGTENAGTVEFLVQGDLSSDQSRYIFLEVNPRIQVEHTITEEITGINLINAQIRVALGESLDKIIGGKPGEVQSVIKLLGGDKSCAAQLRINLLPGFQAETFSRYREPVGYRIDTGVRENGPIVTSYDSMIAKLIVCGETILDLVTKALKALDTYEIEGATINKVQLQTILKHEKFATGEIYTTFLHDLLAAESSASADTNIRDSSTKSSDVEIHKIGSPFPGQITDINVKSGDRVKKGQVLLVISAMKLLNDVVSPCAGKVLEILVKPNQSVQLEQVLMEVEADSFHETSETRDSTSQAASMKLQKREPSARPSSLTSISTVEGRTVDPTSAFCTIPCADVAGSPPPPESLCKERHFGCSQSKVQKNSEAYLKKVDCNKERVEILRERLALVRQGGGKKYCDMNKRRGKYMARDRITQVLDNGCRHLCFTYVMVCVLLLLRV